MDYAIQNITFYLIIPYKCLKLLSSQSLIYYWNTPIIKESVAIVHAADYKIF